MAENRDAKQPTHRAYSVIKREGQDDFWLNLGLVLPHKDCKGLNIMLQAFPLDGKMFAEKFRKMTLRKVTLRVNASNRHDEVAQAAGTGNGRISEPNSGLYDHQERRAFQH
jgi:hypothetical protein